MWTLSSNDTDLSPEFKRKHEVMIGLLENCIDKLKMTGLYKKTQKNILTNVDNWKLITIAVAISLAGLSSGIWINEKNHLFLFLSSIIVATITPIANPI